MSKPMQIYPPQTKFIIGIKIQERKEGCKLYIWFIIYTSSGYSLHFLIQNTFRNLLDKQHHARFRDETYETSMTQSRVYHCIMKHIYL